MSVDDIPSLPEVRDRSRRRISLVALGALVVLAVLLACALFPGLLAPHDPNAQHLSDRLLPAAWSDGGNSSYLLGTDSLGRDLLSRLIYGARTTLGIALAAMLLEMLIGVTLGVSAGYLGGWTDRIVMAWTDLQLSFPAMLLLLVLILAFGNSYGMLVLALAVNGWMIFARVTRSRVLTLRQQSFIDGSVVAGCSRTRIILRHLLPHLRVDIVYLGALEAARLILAESGLSFLGIGVQPPGVSWGLILGDGRTYIAIAPNIATFAGLCISIAVICLTVVGGWLVTSMDPSHAQDLRRLRKRPARKRATSKASAKGNV